jgi:hypothetical protein
LSQTQTQELAEVKRAAEDAELKHDAALTKARAQGPRLHRIAISDRLLST